MHIVQSTKFFKRRTAHMNRELFPKYGSLPWKSLILWSIQKNMCNCEGHILRAYSDTMHFSIVKNKFWTWHCVCKRVRFWHRSRLRHDQLQWDVLHLKSTEMHLLQGALTSKWCKTPFQRKWGRASFTFANLRVWPANVKPPTIRTRNSLAAKTFAFVKQTFWKLRKPKKIA